MTPRGPFVCGLAAVLAAASNCGGGGGAAAPPDGGGGDRPAPQQDAPAEARPDLGGEPAGPDGAGGADGRPDPFGIQKSGKRIFYCYGTDGADNDQWKGMKSLNFRGSNGYLKPGDGDERAYWNAHDVVAVRNHSLPGDAASAEASLKGVLDAGFISVAIDELGSGTPAGQFDAVAAFKKKHPEVFVMIWSTGTSSALLDRIAATGADAIMPEIYSRAGWYPTASTRRGLYTKVVDWARGKGALPRLLLGLDVESVGALKQTLSDVDWLKANLPDVKGFALFQHRGSIGAHDLFAQLDDALGGF